MKLFKVVKVGGKLNDAVVTLVPEARKVRFSSGPDSRSLTLRFVPKQSDLRVDGPWWTRWFRVHGYYSYPENGIRARHPDAPARYNGGVKCDMEIGPCACGAWHYAGEQH